MAGRININSERCKGCGLCADACPNDCITISKASNRKGYFHARSNNTNCSGCAICAVLCPEAIIVVYRDDNIVAVESGKKKESLTREKV